MSARICPQCGTRYEGDNRFCTLDGATLVAENPADSLTGSVLADRYLISRKLGEGGMGEVYLAEHVRMKRKVAVKVMRKALTSDAASLGRFHREAENASQINHPNVAAVYDFGETSLDGREETKIVYLAMEYVDGEPLTEILAREGSLNHVRASDVVSQVAEALAAAHALGILHRDLKPDNVMVARTRSQTDLVKLLDFGIARVMGRDTQHFTSTGLVVGTPEWMSPEQIAGDQPTVRADVYALGLIAFRALTGHGAFGGATSQEVLLAKMTRPPRTLAEVRPDLHWPESLQAAMNRVLSNDPALRYDDALIFAADFYAGISQLPMTADAEAYLGLLSQRSVTPVRLGTIEATPVRGMPTLETPAQPNAAIEAGVPQLSRTVAVKTSETEGSGVTTSPESTVAGGADEAPGAGSDAATPGTGEAEMPTLSVAKQTASRRFPALLAVGVGALVVVGLLVAKLAGGPTRVATLPDSGQRGDTVDSDSIISATGDSTTAAPLTPGEPGAVAPVSSSHPVTPALDSAAIRYRASVFTIVSGRNRGSGFLADTSGTVLTSSMVVGSGTTVDVFLDGARRVIGRIARVDSTQGLAAVVIPVKYCPTACVPIPLAPNRVNFSEGDTVMAVGARTLLSPGSRTKGTISSAAARTLAVAMGLPASAAGAPILLPNGTVLGVAKSGGGRSASLVPASVARTFLRAAHSTNTLAIDSLLPSWPSRPMDASVMAAAVRRTSQDLENFRVRPRGDFEALVMSPQILAFRESEADTLRKYYNPGSPATQYCDGTGPCDPIETWTNLGSYLSERRAVVVIQVAPQRIPPPFRGEHKLVDMNRRPVFLRMELTVNGRPVRPIESHRIFGVVNPQAYPEDQRESLFTGLAVFDPRELLVPDAELEIRVQVQGRDLVRMPVPGSVLAKLGADFPSPLP